MNKKESLLLSLVLLAAVFIIVWNMSILLADDDSNENISSMCQNYPPSNFCENNGTIIVKGIDSNKCNIYSCSGPNTSSICQNYPPPNFCENNGTIIVKGIDSNKCNIYSCSGSTEDTETNGSTVDTDNNGSTVDTDNNGSTVDTDNNGSTVDTDNNGSTTNNESGEDNPNLISAQNQNKTKNAEKIKEAVQERNRLRIHSNNSECPGNCTCTGVVIKCKLENGTREMTVYAQSGNIIFQVKEINATTNVTLYQHDGKVYGVNEDNETKIINYLPDQIQEKIRERTRARLNNTNISLNENGEYEYEAEKEARFFGIFKVHEKVSWNIDAETGNISNENAPWWGFLASDVKEE